ncbi:YjcZ family sporulation protein [Viridibacillus sp. NPDC093762]
MESGGEFREERRERNPFAFIIVLFILLIIVGSSFMHHRSHCC